jgi:BirA family biotin operon repressor/biotin-[acetyl-CoA-carboxylase] ligase
MLAEFIAHPNRVPESRSNFEPLAASVINAALGSQAPRFRVDIVQTCESTNTVLLDRAQHGAPAGSVIACEQQTAGRGRRGRTWQSVRGDSLTFSLLWRFPAGAQPLTGLSLAVGVAVARALEAMGASGVHLKWPNDILTASGKLGGILVETLSLGTAPVAVIGIGLNVRLPRSIAESPGVEASELAAVMPCAPSRNQLLARLLVELGAMLGEFAQSGFAAFAQDWLDRHAFAGEMVRILADGAAPIEGRCAGVDADGALLLDTAQGTRRIVSGEVSLRPAASPARMPGTEPGASGR